MLGREGPAEPPPLAAPHGERQVFGDGHRRSRPAERILEDAADQLSAHIKLSQVEARKITLFRLQSARRSLDTENGPANGR